MLKSAQQQQLRKWLLMRKWLVHIAWNQVNHWGVQPRSRLKKRAPPPSDLVRINVDAAIIASSSSSAIGVEFRNHIGTCLLAYRKSFCGVSCAGSIGSYYSVFRRWIPGCIQEIVYSELLSEWIELTLTKQKKMKDKKGYPDAMEGEVTTWFVLQKDIILLFYTSIIGRYLL